MKKLFRILTVAGIFIFILLFASWMVIRHVMISEARKQANEIHAEILKENPNPTDDEIVIATTRAVFNRLERIDPARIPLYRINPYISNRRLPEFIRLPRGVMAALLGKGYCDNAARWLMFILSQENFKSVQWNMISPILTHAGLLVTMHDGRKILADPFHGYVTINKKGRLISPYEAQDLIRDGHKFKDVFLPLGEKSNPQFYEKFAETNMEAQGDPLILISQLPSVKNKPLILGTINGDSVDVKNAGNNMRMGQYWSYMGHKYSRKWVRILKVNEPVKIVMTFTEEPADGIMRVADHPEVSGKTATWNLRRGEDLILIDGLARISWRNLRSYVGVDQIKVTYNP